jgi:hypothetical protein
MDSDEAPERRPQRSKKYTRIHISDGEDGESGSEYADDQSARTSLEDGQMEQSDDNGLSVEGSTFEDEELPMKTKAKTKAKVKAKSQPKPKPKKGALNKSMKAKDTDEDMDIDNVPPNGYRAKKRKSDVMSSDDEDSHNPKKAKKAKAKVSRAGLDPWKLKTSTVQKNWKEMKVPPLEIFHFHRLVIDEYTYLDGKTHSLITNLQATCRWVLSGTPPVHDFPSLKTIAVFLDVHLGIDDDNEGQSAQVKKRRREQTGRLKKILVAL